MEQNFINKSQSQEEPQQNPPYTPNTNSQSSDTTYNSTQNTPPPEQPYYSSQSTDNSQQYPTQSYPAQPYPTQNMVIPPNQSYYPPQGSNPIQPGVPMNNYPLQSEALNVQPIPQNQYYKPYSLVQHKGISQTDTNTFYISFGFCAKCTPCFIFFIGLSFMTVNILFISGTILFYIFLLFLFVCSTIFCFTSYNSMFIVLGSNNLTVIHKAICNKDITIYNPGELERIDFTYTPSQGKGNKTSHKYSISVVRKNGKTECIYSLDSKSIRFTQDEIEYFVYTVNTHIQTKMRV